jgi:radical SAM protein with 4Fe4S-binding SPASM domain
MWGIPPVITVEPTNYCNLKCPLCVTGNGSMERAGGRMSFDTFRRLIDDIGDEIWYVILYHQGEPYLNKAFLQCVEYAKSKGLYTETSTNGHYLNRENAELTVKSGLDATIVSVDGTTQESYEHYRVNGKLDKVISGIQNLVAAKRSLGSKTPYVLLQFLVMKHNEHEIPQIEAMAQELGVDRLLKKNIQVESHQQALEWLPSQEKHQRYSIGESDIEVRRNGKGVCPRPWLSSLMNWDGSVVPCCFDKNGAHAMGDIWQADEFSHLWNTSEYQDFRTNMLRNRDKIDICRNCNQGFGIWI